jgi:hypothetical protein
MQNYKLRREVKNRAELEKSIQKAKDHMPFKEEEEEKKKKHIRSENLCFTFILLYKFNKHIIFKKRWNVLKLKAIQF